MNNNATPAECADYVVRNIITTHPAQAKRIRRDYTIAIENWRHAKKKYGTNSTQERIKRNTVNALQNEIRSAEETNNAD